MSNTIEVNLGHDNELEELLVRKYNHWANLSNVTRGSLKTTVRHSNTGLNSFHYQDIEGINTVHNSVVLVNCLTEGIHSRKFFKQYCPSNFYVIFSNCTWDKSQHDFGINYVNLPHYLFLSDMIDSSVSLYKETAYNHKHYDFAYPKPNVFVSTAGGDRGERDVLINRLVNQLSFQNYVLKYKGINFGQDYNRLDYYCQTNAPFDAYGVLPNLDQLTLSRSIPGELYNQAYFKLVVETDVTYSHSFFPTEKIAKALISGIPFVVYSTQHFLKHLQGLGFATFGDFWDESYDDEPDYENRAAMIVDLCNQLASFDWQANRSSLVDIANKNAANFLRNNSTYIDQFERIHRAFGLITQYEVDYLQNNQHLFETS